MRSRQAQKMPQTQKCCREFAELSPPFSSLKKKLGFSKHAFLPARTENFRLFSFPPPPGEAEDGPELDEAENFP